MLDRSKTQLSVAVFIFIAILASFSYLFVIAAYHRDIPFLRTSPEANWILYYLYPDTVARDSSFTNISTDFTKDFNLPSTPPKAELRIKAFKKYRLWINDDEVLRSSITQTNWKKIDMLDISRLLRKGKNTIKVKVTCKCGPPALWLYTQGLQNDIKTDTTWAASISGSPAVLASLANDCFVPQITLEGRRPLNALVKKLPMLIVFFAVSLAVFWLHNYKQKSAKLNGCFYLRFLTFTPKSVLILSIALWTVLWINNVPKIPLTLGFDASRHLEYVEYLLKHCSIPLANQAWQGYQPPLFYTLSALLFSFTRIFSKDSAYLSLKLIPFICGIGQICLAYFAARIFFPSSKTKQALSVAVAALIPMNIYISHYISNESLCAFLMSLSMLVAVAILNRKHSSLGLFCLLGLIIGLALLTKFTILAILPVISLILLYKLLSEEKSRLVTLARYFGLMFLLIVVVAGWFYVRNWAHFGKPFVGNWDHDIVVYRFWWQDPGFHTYKYFFQFGRVFSLPYFAGFYSLFDSLYSTFWGDGLLGGGRAYIFRPPWNYEYMSAVYLLAIPATLAIVIGALRATGNAIFAANKIWLLMLGSLFIMVWSMVYMNLLLPYYSQAKAFYSLWVVLPVSLMFAFGFDYLDKWLRDKKLSLLRAVLYGWFGTLALAIFFSFLVRPAQIQKPLDSFAPAGRGKLIQPITHYTQSLHNNSSDHDAHCKLVTSADEKDLAKEIQERLYLYKSDQPHRRK